MKRTLLTLLFSCFILLASLAQTNILIITGGHDFEKESFYELFDSFPNLTYDTLIQPAGNEILGSSKINQYDALVYYDMFQQLTKDQKTDMINLLEKGKGIVFLHHALVSYQDWPEFQNIIGGKYLLSEVNGHPKSTYKHDVNIPIEIVDHNHPITSGLDNFQIRDEVYGDFLVNSNVTPLLKTNHPLSTELIGWCHTYSNSKIVYLQSGHDHHAFENRNFRKLLINAIHWVSSSDLN